jgi:hypothetical protein
MRTEQVTFRRLIPLLSSQMVEMPGIRVGGGGGGGVNSPYMYSILIVLGPR